MKKIVNKTMLPISILSLLVLILVGSCKQRDDYPDFSNWEPPKPVEDIIPPDNNITPLVQKIMAGTSFFKTFLLDSTVSVGNGVTYYHTRFLNNLDQKVSMHVVEIDLTKGNVTMNTLSPYDDYLYSTQILTEMMQMNQETISGNLLVGIVGDLSTPTGTFVRKSRVIKTNTSRTLPYIGVKKGSDNVVIANSSDATKYPVPAIVPADYSSLVAGNTWLIYMDNNIVSLAATATARTSIGFTVDKKIYCVAVDGVNDFSAGISLNNMRDVFKAMSCNNAFYINGAASNSLAIKEGDKWVLKSIPQTGVAPAVGTGIGFVLK